MKYLLLLSALIIIQNSLTGQTLSGTVTDKTGIPIPGADIIILRTGEHSHSDESGRFVFTSVQLRDTLKAYRIGYASGFCVVNSLNKPLKIKLTENPITLDEVIICPKLDAINIISEVDIQITPVNSSQEILRQVPGLIIGQHAGGGKAEQIFLRGFDIDHGTDINITSDGIPVNMVSHAHGQGYADLHFIIPETIDKIDFGKGPYYADKGDFTTAGYANLRTRNSLDSSILSMEVGQFNMYRLLGMFNAVNTPKHQGYIVAEFISADGPFESPQNFNRFNIFGKYTSYLSASDKLRITVSHFNSKWDASGQIPQRAVNSGLITRFGAIDDTEGGYTSRTNLIVDYDKQLSEKAFICNKLYYSLYDFELYSNFTFFFEDSINGDQIKQKEHRNLLGLSSIYNQEFELGKIHGLWRTGISLKNDYSKDNELSHTLDRQEIIEQYQLGDINQTNFGGFVDATIEIGKWSFNPAVRIDYFDFQYNDALSTYKTQSETQTIISPKLNILYNQSQSLQLYLKAGKGFHSNDTRVVIQQQGKEILPAAYGFDAGYIWKPARRLLLNMAYWSLYLEQEFVYVGDAGIVEPSGKTRRHGADFSVRYQPFTWLFANADLTYTYARAVDESQGEDFIPLAPDFTATGGFDIILKSGLYGGVKLRHISDRPANEDNSIVAIGYTIVDFNLGYNVKRFDIGIQVQNLLDTEWNETQFATESRLEAEAIPVEEIHFIPGTPLNIIGRIQYRF